MNNIFMKSGARPSIFHRHICEKLMEKDAGLEGVLHKDIVKQVLFCNGVPVKHHNDFLRELSACGLVRLLKTNKKDYSLQVLPLISR